MVFDKPEPNEPPADAAPPIRAASRRVRSRKSPLYRRLRAFAFDPILGTQLESLGINQVTLPVVWEENLLPGPVGEYLEVIDHDPSSGCYYTPVDLNSRELLATDGLAPSEGNPQFHQQMVYAVAMATIRHFEQALGRKALWAPRRIGDGPNMRDEYVARLRIYPHAMREANAYYSPEKKALLFGYFPASTQAPGRNMPGGVVFTCLSHDIIAHETTHALLDGIHRRFIEDSNPDVFAFHEAFADAVALFQHFTLPDVLRNQVAGTRGDLSRENLLGQLAQQFGEAIGHHGALRDAIGRVDPDTGRWEPLPPDPQAYTRTLEPHGRGAILVAALFDAFLSIYRARTADLYRIATGGTGVLPAGALHPDIVERLAQTASKVARQVLTMTIRALDYCPPIDITFGEFLRALITADAELVQDDDLGYRVAFVEAFRRRGLYPSDVRSLAPDSLIWNGPEEQPGGAALFERFVSLGDPLLELFDRWDLSSDRRAVHEYTGHVRVAIHRWMKQLIGAGDLDTLEALTGLALANTAPRTIARDRDGQPLFEVHAVRPVRRVGPDGQLAQNLVVEITQQRAGFHDPQAQARADSGADATQAESEFTFRGGCTLVFNLETAMPLYFVRKGILSEDRLARQRDYRYASSSNSTRVAFFGSEPSAEPFAILHRGN